LKAINPDLLLSMSPSPDEWGLVEYLQDSQTWVVTLALGLRERVNSVEVLTENWWI